MDTQSKPKEESAKPRGWPREKSMAPLIPDTPENTMKTLVNAPPRAEDDWDYRKDSVGYRLVWELSYMSHFLPAVAIIALPRTLPRGLCA